MAGEPIPTLQWIEAASSVQIPSFQIVGLPAPEVAEARERIRAAIEASSLEFPRRRIVLNLSPASIRKRGTGLDLAMALGVLLEAEIKQEASGASLNRREPPRGAIVAWGELGLDGTVKPAGQLTRALYASWREHAQAMLIAQEDYEAARRALALIQEAREVEGAPPKLIQVRTLSEAWKALLERLSAPLESSWAGPTDDDVSAALEVGVDARLGETGRDLMPLAPSLERVLGVASAGSHHLLLIGPRGTGKSHALEWLAALQPTPVAEVRLRQALLAELSSLEPERFPWGAPPLCRVSPQARPAALVGSASPGFVRPGAFSLAHGGVLLADELPEWPRDSRECLREPMESGKVVLNRAHGTVELPASFLLAATGNLCPCGGWPARIPLPSRLRRDSTARCRCSRREQDLYRSRLSGPILDRIDMILPMYSSGFPDLIAALDASISAKARLRALRERILATRILAQRLYSRPPGRLTGAELEELLARRPELKSPLGSATRGSSLRGRHKVLRIALTLSCWDGADAPAPGHFSEAAMYRAERFGLPC